MIGTKAIKEPSIETSATMYFSFLGSNKSKDTNNTKVKHILKKISKLIFLLATNVSVNM